MKTSVKNILCFILCVCASTFVMHDFTANAQRIVGYFEMQNQLNANANNKSSSSREYLSNSNSNIVETYKDYMSYGIYTITQVRKDGVKVVSWHRPCPSCKGTRRCSVCNATGKCAFCSGAGIIVTPGYYNTYPCYGCNQTGTCHSCNGGKMCFCAKSTNDGTVISTVQTLDSKGNVINSNHEDYGANTSRPTKGSSKKSTSSSSCVYCEGSGVNLTPTTAQPISKMTAYYNRKGDKCPYCSKFHEHWHHKCLH